jgi:hypothetical protein
MDSNSHLTRRRFLATTAAGLAVIPLSQFVAATACGADLPHLSPDDPAAKALGYTADGSKLTAQKEATFKAGSHCANCALYQTAQASNGWAPCAAFPGKAVNANGWCRAWSAAG